jgi:exodeoxyribonuclease VII large subunit
MSTAPLPVPDGVKVLSVTELTRMVQGLLEEAFPFVWVSGEVSNLKRSLPGHIYFTLKDSQTQIRAVLWQSTAQRVRFKLEDGLQVIVRGRVTVYPVKGDYQIQVQEIQPKGLGALELALRQLTEKLRGLGWFAAERKKPLPRFPQRIALVTSAGGAAIRDMLRIIPRRWPDVEIWLCPVQVQGEGAARDIAAAIGMLNRLGGIDVMIVGRGGGSLEDLWAFNEEPVARAIFESRIPVISAVGHEVDFTIADHVADKRAATPSEAAELVVPDLAAVEQDLCRTANRLRDALVQRLNWSRQRLDDLAGRRVLQRPLEQLEAASQKLDAWTERLRRAAAGRSEQMEQRLRAIAGRLASLSPLNVLERGYSVTLTEAGAAVRSAQQVRPGERIVTRLLSGRIISEVQDAQSEDLPS